MTRSQWFPFLGVLAIALVILFTNLGQARLFDDDEGKNSTCGREMLERGDWIVPTFNHDLRTDKPVLIYWFMIVSYQVFGVNEFAARFWSAVWGIGSVALTCALGRRLFGASVGYWAGLMLATSLMFDVAARAATPDSTLIFFATLAMWLFVRYVPNAIPTGDQVPHSDHTSGELLSGARWYHFVPTYAAMGGAVLAKGPVGVVLPTAVMVTYVVLFQTRFKQFSQPAAGWRERLAHGGSYLLSVLSPRPVWQAIRLLRPLVAFAVVGLVALPWYVAVGIETNGAWLAGFLGKHNVHRFLEPMEGHRGPIFYYVIAVIIGFFPWSIFLSLSVINIGREVRRDARWNPAYLFVACWAGFYLGFFSLAGTKLPSYILPAYPAVAIIVAAFVVAWQRDAERFRGFLLRLALASVPLVGLGVVIALPIVAYFVLPGEGWLGLIGLLLVAGGGYAFWQAEAGRTTRATAALAVTSVLFSIAVFDFAAPHVGGFQNSASVVAAMRQNADGEAQLATLDYFVPSLPYYAGARIERCGDLDEAATFLREHPKGYLVTREKHLEELQKRLPQDVVQLQRQRRFLRSGEIILLGRPAQTAQKTKGQTRSG